MRSPLHTLRAHVLGAVLLLGWVAAAEREADADPASDDSARLEEAVRGALSRHWQVVRAQGGEVRATFQLYGWGKRKHCVEDLPARKQRRLQQDLDALADGVGRWSAGRDQAVSVDLDIAGRSDALDFGHDPFQQAPCASKSGTPPAGNDFVRLGWYRAASVGDVATSAFAGRGISVATVLHGERDPDGKTGRKHRGATIVLTVRRQSEQPTFEQPAVEQPIVERPACEQRMIEGGDETAGPIEEAPPPSPGHAVSVVTVRRSQPLLVAAEGDLGIMVPLVPSIHDRLYRYAAVARLGARFRAGKAQLRPHVLLVGSRTAVRFNSIDQPQVLGGLGVDLELALPLGRRFRAGPRVGGTRLWREIERSDLPISLPERQGGFTVSLGGFLQAEFPIARSLAVTVQASADYMLLRLDDEFAGSVNLQLGGGISHAF